MQKSNFHCVKTANKEPRCNAQCSFCIDWVNEANELLKTQNNMKKLTLILLLAKGITYSQVSEIQYESTFVITKTNGTQQEIVYVIPYTTTPERGLFKIVNGNLVNMNNGDIVAENVLYYRKPKATTKIKPYVSI